MGLLDRLRGGSPASVAASEEDRATAVEGAAPGTAALFEGVGDDRSHSVLDLGPAAEASLRVYGRFARWVRFADLLAGVATQPGPGPTLETVPVHPDRPYDLLLAWDLLDRVFPEERASVIARLARISAPDARLHLIVRSSADAPTAPLRFTLTEVGRMRYETIGPPRRGRPRLLPAEVEAVLDPFRVVRGFTLKGGLREYVAIRSGG